MPQGRHFQRGESGVDFFQWNDERLEEIRERLRLSIRGKKSYLKDPEANLAVMTDFELTENLRICRWCNFKAVCRPELQETFDGKGPSRTT